MRLHENLHAEYVGNNFLGPSIWLHLQAALNAISCSLILLHEEWLDISNQITEAAWKQRRRFPFILGAINTDRYLCSVNCLWNKGQGCKKTTPYKERKDDNNPILLLLPQESFTPQGKQNAAKGTCHLEVKFKYYGRSDGNPAGPVFVPALWKDDYNKMIFQTPNSFILYVCVCVCVILTW